MILVLLVVSAVGFVCAVALTLAAASRSTRDCREWLQERQDRDHALQQREAERVARDEGLALVAGLNHAYYELPAYEGDGSRR
jgi:hypothetical protein